jgi:hypothetical protein
MSKAKQFLELQDKVNNEIDTFGQATTKSVEELDALGKSLTHKEIDEVCELALKLKMY